MPNLDMITGNMGNARALAEQLRQMGRGRDTMLAHITPEEADMLLQAGGSGSINPQTGLPEFQPQDSYFSNFDLGSYEDVQAASPDIYGYGYEPRSYYASEKQNPLPFEAKSTGSFGAAPSVVPAMPPRIQEVGIPPSQTTPELRFNRPLRTDPFAFVPGVEGTREVYGGEQPGLLSRIEGAGRKFEQFAAANPATTRLGTAGLNLGLTALLARRAGREREAYANELRGMAQPYAQAQQEALARAQGGGMTAPQQRAFDIAQARARQGLSAQNLGAGSAAAGIQTAQSQRARTLARQESFDSAMDAARIRDSYLREAARQELAADTDLANALIGVLQGEIREATTTQASAPQQQRR
jgi:hypothetical protein